MSVERSFQPLIHFVDEAGVRGLYQKLKEAWNLGIGEAFGEVFEESGDLIGFDGTHLKGRRQIASFHQQLFDKWLKGTRLVGTVTRVGFLKPDVAVVHAIGGTVMPGKSKPAPERDSIQTLVAVKRGGKWRFAAFQNTRVRPMGANTRHTLMTLFTDWLWRFFGTRNQRQFPKSTRVGG